MNLLPLLNSTNRHRFSSESSSKRKSAALAQKAAPTCTLSLTSVSVSVHGSSDSLNFIPFPSTTTTVPFPSEPIPIPTSTSTLTSPTTNVPPRPRVRTQASLLRRKRPSARLLAQPEIPPCSSQVESEPDQVSSTPPRKRARKASISSPSISSPLSLSSSSPSSSPLTPTSSYHSLTISSQPLPRKSNGKTSKKAAADLRFLCTFYRSIAWLRLQRDFSEATRCLINVPVQDSMMDVDSDMDIPSPCVSALDAQERLLMSRLRSYLIFNEMNPQWLDITPLPSLPPAQQGADIFMDGVNVRGGFKLSPVPSTTTAQPSTIPSQQQQQHQQLPPMLSSDQVIASLVFRYRYRSKGKSRPEAPPIVNSSGGTEGAPIRMRKRSPLAAPGAH